MAWNIYIEDGEAIPAIKIETTPPAGFTISSNPTIDWDKYSEHITGSDLLKASEIRTEIKAEYDSITWGSGSAAQKAVWSKWFVATKAERDTVHSAAVQEANAEALADVLVTVRNKQVAADVITAIKDAEPSAVDSEVQDTEEGGNTIVTSGTGTKFLRDDGTYATVKYRESFFYYEIAPTAGTYNSVVCGSSASVTSLYERNKFYALDKVAEEALMVSLMLPGNYTDGSNLKVTIVTTDDTDSSGVRLQCGLTQPSATDGFGSSTETEWLASTITTSLDWKVRRTEFTFDGTNITAADALSIILFRDTQHADDDLNGDTYVFSITIEEL